MPKKSYKELLIKHLKKTELYRYNIGSGDDLSDNQYLSGFEGTDMLETGVAVDTLKNVLNTSDVCLAIADMMKYLSFEFIHSLRIAIENTPREYITPSYFKNLGLPRKISAVIKEWRMIYNGQT